MATADDLRGIAEVIVSSWRSAYPGLLPDRVLDELDVDARHAHLVRKQSEEVKGRSMIVAYEGDEAVGTIWVGPEHNDTDTDVGEVYAIYVIESRWDTGVGYALMQRGLDELRSHGFTSAVLWVIEGNERARRFYERTGWVADTAIKLEEWGDFQIQEARYAFSPL